MTELSRLQSQYDAFLFASLGDTDVTPSVLSVLAREDVDPWQEAARLAELSPEQAINSLASKIWKSNSERWSPSEASILALRLIELLPSHSAGPPAGSISVAAHEKELTPSSHRIGTDRDIGLPGLNR